MPMFYKQMGQPIRFACKDAEVEMKCVASQRPPPHQNQRYISGLTLSSASKSLTSILDLMDSAYSQLDDLTRRLDRSSSEISKDVEAFHSLLHESFKVVLFLRFRLVCCRI
ncbi:hypothetical protein NL676_019107 [Syzygium grande]|nr:hypothetical protein NL676_019107 [Syzygium grande]